MPKIKIEKYWPSDIKKLATILSKNLEKKNFQASKETLQSLLNILKNTERDGRSRVSVCFIIDQLKMIDPFIDIFVQNLEETLEKEQDVHVKEFAVWALGQIVEESRNLELIKETMPIFVKFCTDSSEHVKVFAEDIKDRLNGFIEEKEILDEKIAELLAQITELVMEKIKEMEQRAKNLSKEALELDYKAAFERKSEMEGKIKKFKKLNALSEDEIITFQKELTEKISAFKGESKDIIQKWREIRGNKEALIRRVHCIIRIQSKIYRIITHIKNKNDGKIDISELKEETSYSDYEIIEILKKLVDEEIIPNFMLDSVAGNLEVNIESKDLISAEEKIAKREAKLRKN